MTSTIKGKLPFPVFDKGEIIFFQHIIQLRFQNEGKLTPGTVSFTTSLLAIFSRIKKLPNLTKLSDIYDAAISWSENVEIPLNATTFLVGTGLTYPLAIYGKAKIYETLG